MAAIGQIDPAGTASIRGLGPGTAVGGLAQDQRDEEFIRADDIDRADERAQQRSDAATQVSLGGETAADAGLAQIGNNANANQLNATDRAGDDTDTQSILQNEIATTDQQLPTPFDPNRGTQLDIAV